MGRIVLVVMACFLLVPAAFSQKRSMEQDDLMQQQPDHSGFTDQRHISDQEEMLSVLAPEMSEGVNAVDWEGQGDNVGAVGHMQDYWYSAQDVVLSGNYAFVATARTGLRILDISDPSNPSQIGFLDTPGYAFAVAVQGNYAYVAEQADYPNGSLRVIDISDPANPSETGFLLTPGSARGVAVQGDYAYVACFNDGLRVVDISNPASPTEVGFYDSPDRALDVYLDSSYAYLADGSSGLRILEITDPTAPTELGFLDTPGSAFDVVVDGNYAYVADMDAGIRIINITDPANPVETGNLTSSRSSRKLAVVNGYAYVTDETSYTGGFSVIDVSDPTSPVETGHMNMPDDALGVVTNDSLAYVASSLAGIRVVDISDPNTPAEHAAFDTPSNIMDVAVEGNVASLLDLSDGLRSIDISDPANPVEVGAYQTEGYARAVTMSDGYAYIAYGASGLRIVNLADPTNPVETGFVDTPDDASGVAVEGDYAYVADYDGGLRLIDISNPASPFEVGSYVTPGYANDVAIAGTLACVADGSGDLRVLDVVDPTNPTEVGSCDLPDHALYVELSGSYAYVSTWTDSLFVVDISNPSNPVQVGAIDQPGNGYGLAVDGGYAYLSNGNLYVADLSDPIHPVQTGHYYTDGNSRGIATDSDYIYLADSFDMMILQHYRPPAGFDYASPDSGTVIHEEAVTVHWNATTDPNQDETLHYVVEWSQDAAFTTPYSGSTTDTFFTMTELADDNAIYWRVKATDSRGYQTIGEGGNAWSISVDLYDAPLSFNLVSPTSADTVWTLDTALLWQAAMDPDPYNTPHYDVYLDTRADFSTVQLMADSTADTTLALTDLLDDQMYYWTVRATDTNTGGTWAVQTGSFLTYSIEAPSAFAFTGPDSGSTVHSDTVTVHWAPSTDPDPNDPVEYVVEWSPNALFTSIYSGTTTDTFFTITDLADAVLSAPLGGGSVDRVDLGNAVSKGRTALASGTISPGGDMGMDALPDDNMLFWRVKAVDSFGSETAGQGGDAWSFAVDVYDAPDPFALIGPASPDTVWTLDTTLTWDAATDPDPYDTPHYDVWLGTLADLSNATLVGDSVSASSLDLMALDDNTVYYWTVRATDSNTSGTWTGDTLSFSTYQVEAPTAFAYVAPDSGASLHHETVTVHWAPSSDPDPNDSIGYLVEWSANPAFSTAYSGTTTDTFFTITDLADAVLSAPLGGGSVDRVDLGNAVSKGRTALASGTISPGGDMGMDALPDDNMLFWRVKAVDSFGSETAGQGGDAWSFAVDVYQTPDAFALTSPLAGDTCWTLDTTLVWSSTTDPDPYDTTCYDLWVGTLPDLSDAQLVADSTADTTFGLTELFDDTVYYWTVRATDSNSGGTWASDTLSFATYLPEPPEGFALLFPDSGAVVYEDSVRFRWASACDPDPGDSLVYVFHGEIDGEAKDTSVTDTFFVVKGLPDDSEFSWTVSVIDGFGNEVTCDADTVGWTFSTYFPEPPAPFSLLSPQNGFEFPDEREFPLTFRWQFADDPDPEDSLSYQLELATDEQFSDPLTYEAGEADSFAVPSLDRASWYWRVVATDRYALETASSETWVVDVTLSAAEMFSGVPTEYSISSLYPNPFNPTMTVVIGLPEAAELRVAVYNVVGRRVAELAHGNTEQGYHRLTFDGSHMASGVYFVRAHVPGKLNTVKKVVLMR